MSRQPTLAEILADDTGNIRAEVADLLLEPHAQRPIRLQQARPHRNFPVSSLIVIGAIIVLVCVAIGVVSGSNHSRTDKVEMINKEVLANSAADLVSTSDAKSEDQVVNGNDQNQAAETEGAVSSIARTSNSTAKIGYVNQNNVPVLTIPGVEGEVITTVHQSTTLPIISFNSGWYEVMLSNYSIGYIFGAYFSPYDFNPYPYIECQTRDRSNLLVKDVGSPDDYLAVWPDGRTTWVAKNSLVCFGR